MKLEEGTTGQKGRKEKHKWDTRIEALGSWPSNVVTEREGK